MRFKAMIFSVVLVGLAAGVHHSALADGDDHGGLRFSFGFFPPPTYYQPLSPPVYYQPQRPPLEAYYAPPPVYYQPAPEYWGHQQEDDDEGDDD